MSQGNLEGLLNCSLEKLKGLVDVNTIIGQPITAPDGTIIVPVSKVAFGYGSGGSDFGGDKPKDMFGGGSGADNTADRAVGIVPDLIDKFADIFSKSKKEKGEQ